MTDDEHEVVQVIKTYFFDASAIVKLFVQEPGSERVRDIQYGTAIVHTSWVLIAEAMGVLKRKWQREEIPERQYGAAVYHLFALVREGRISPVDLTIESGRPKLATWFDYEVIQIRKKYPDLDVADALQFKAIQAGILKYLVGESTPQLVTADEALLKAARAEGLPVVYVATDL